MATTLETIWKSIEENSKNLAEVIKERLFSPMYFYFIIAWLITNWKFAYTFLFTNEEVVGNIRKILKIEYLGQFYQFDSFASCSWSVSKLILIPAFSAYIAVWWFSRLSERFYERNETYKKNKRVILRWIEYEEKVSIAKKEREIRDAQADKKEIRYEDNEEFNSDFDDNSKEVQVAGITMRPSEVLYNTDYEAYKAELEEWKGANGRWESDTNNQ